MTVNLLDNSVDKICIDSNCKPKPEEKSNKLPNHSHRPRRCVNPAEILSEPDVICRKWQYRQDHRQAHYHQSEVALFLINHLIKFYYRKVESYRENDRPSDAD
jgi:hypothetical protein